MQNLTRDELRQRLLACGLKATHQRIVVFETVMALHGQHPVAEEVYQLLKPANPSISLGTVYKTLDTFVESGLINRVFTEEGGKRYDPNTEAHSHIYCSNTKEIIDFEDAELDQLLLEFFKTRNMENFQFRSCSVQLMGCKVEPDKKVTIQRVSK
ncbi:Fur family transcriptional regulator [Pontibacter roseus]|uniref:Fur family transcriptional regulator n=1 Tax=Pontibacter roseus TaxID=336989 RepID=UPI00037835B6|nr:transcriptional repressor [Pontibacter roseus]